MVNEKLKSMAEEGKTLTEITAIIKDAGLIEGVKDLRDVINKRIKKMGFIYDKNSGTYFIGTPVVKEAAPKTVPTAPAIHEEKSLPVAISYAEINMILNEIKTLKDRMDRMERPAEYSENFNVDLLETITDPKLVISSIRINKSVWDKFHRVVAQDLQLGRLSKTDVMNLLLLEAIEKMKN